MPRAPMPAHATKVLGQSPEERVGTNVRQRFSLCVARASRSHHAGVNIPLARKRSEWRRTATPFMWRRTCGSRYVLAMRAGIAVAQQEECHVAERPMKMPAKKNSDDEAPEVVSQRAKPERGRYLLQVDRQTKGSFQDMEAAQSAGRKIKAGFPILHVAIYDSVNSSHTLVQLPAKKDTSRE